MAESMVGASFPVVVLYAFVIVSLVKHVWDFI